MASTSPTTTPTHLLCIVPVSATAMTEDLRRLHPSTDTTHITFLDGRDLPACPPCIESHDQAVASSDAIMPRVLDYMSTNRSTEAEEKEVDVVGGVGGAGAGAVDGVLVCCFSDHPLVQAVQEAFPHVPVTGIFQAALEEATAVHNTTTTNNNNIITYSSSNSNKTTTTEKFGIVTTAEAWEKPLTTFVTTTLAGSAASRCSVGVLSTGLGVLELETLPRSLVVDRIATVSKQLVDRGASRIVLGCAGLAALESHVRRALPDGVVTVEGVRAGIRILAERSRRRRL